MKQELHSITARITTADYKEVQRIAVSRKVSEAEVIRILMRVGVEAHKDMERLGLIGIIDLAYYVKEAIKRQSAGKQLPLPM